MECISLLFVVFIDSHNSITSFGDNGLAYLKISLSVSSTSRFLPTSYNCVTRSRSATAVTRLKYLTASSRRSN